MMILKSALSFPWMAVFLLMGIIIPESHGYASWLKCYVELDDTEVIMNHYVVPSNKADHSVEIEIQPEGASEWMTSPVVYVKPGMESVKVRLKVPQALQMETVQYVVETTEGALFADSTMCDGKRAYARDYDTEVVLKFNDDFSTNKSHAVEIWAGWAMGHEEVRLTPRLKLEPRKDEQEL
mmetsp:Transcript_4072/g.5330  ORF Transcript_4072/g.5330 Transcript_4072/m.5330 type:complete len:181 (-) Transcript_4072:257-799(-)